MLGTIIGVCTTLATWEALWWVHRRDRRGQMYQEALAHAKELGRPLVVIGAPDGGVTRGYPCGDYTVDLASSACPKTVQADITRPLPFADNSVVVVCMCVLEYVDNAEAALHEIQRISGGHMFFVGVPPWTLTSVLYPGAKRTLPAQYR